VCETENRVCGKTLKFFSDVGGDHGSSAKIGSTPRLSRNVSPSILNHSHMTGNALASALLVVLNLENVARFVGGRLLHSRGLPPSPMAMTALLGFEDATMCFLHL